MDEREQWDPKKCICQPFRDPGGMQDLSRIDPPGRWFVKDPQPECPERGKRGHPQPDEEIA